MNEVLGVEPEITLGELREEIERAGVDPRYQIPSGMTKQAYLEMRLSDAIVEEDDYDLMVMGRTQGQGCYCFVNGLVQTQVQKLQSHYPYIVVDNEAGMEHISRGILPMMEVAILVSDADANANLNEVLGVEPEITLGELREEIERAGVDPRYQIPSGMTKQAYLEMRLSDAIAEEDDYDLMVMGRTQGQGCYCFVNGLCRPRFRNCKVIIHILWLITKQVWNISAEESCQ